MGKKRLVISRQKLRHRNPKFEYPIIQKIAGSEAATIIDNILFEPKYSKPFKKMQSNFLIVTLVSAIEYDVRHFVRKFIDENHIDVSRFFKDDIQTFLKKPDLERKVSVGHLFSMTYYFGNPDVINDVLSDLLGVDFFETIKLLDAEPGMEFSIYRRARRLHTNWANFIRMFEMRNNIVHDLKRYDLKPTQMRSLANNTFMFVENLGAFSAYYFGKRHNMVSNSIPTRIIEQQMKLYQTKHKVSKERACLEIDSQSK